MAVVTPLLLWEACRQRHSSHFLSVLWSPPLVLVLGSEAFGHFVKIGQWNLHLTTAILPVPDLHHGTFDLPEDSEYPGTPRNPPRRREGCWLDFWRDVREHDFVPFAYSHGHVSATISDVRLSATRPEDLVDYLLHFEIGLWRVGQRIPPIARNQAAIGKPGYLSW